MSPLENRSEQSVATEISTQTTCPPRNLVHRAVWTLSLMTIGSVLAIHGALAYSPEFARYVPEVLLQPPAKGSSSCSQQACPTGGCQARALMMNADFGGCCSMRVSDEPILTDGLYHEEDEVTSDSLHVEGPVDALECLPESSESSESLSPQAAAPGINPTVATSNE